MRTPWKLIWFIGAFALALGEETCSTLNFCSGRGTCDGKSCTCQWTALLEDCSATWNDYHSLLWPFQYTFLALFSILTIFSFWRATQVIRSKVHRKAKVFSPQVITLVLSVVGCIFHVILFIDRKGASGFLERSTINLSYFLGSSFFVTGLFLFVRLFVAIRAAFHPRSKIVVLALDILSVGYQVVAIGPVILTLMALHDQANWFFQVLTGACIITVMCGMSVYSLGILSTIHKQTEARLFSRRDSARDSLDGGQHVSANRGSPAMSIRHLRAASHHSASMANLQDEQQQLGHLMRMIRGLQALGVAFCLCTLVYLLIKPAHYTNPTLDVAFNAALHFLELVGIGTLVYVLGNSRDRHEPGTEAHVSSPFRTARGPSPMRSSQPVGESQSTEKIDVPKPITTPSALLAPPFSDLKVAVDDNHLAIPAAVNVP